MKTRLLAVLVFSSLLVLTAAAAVLAQGSGGDSNPSVQYVDCSQVQSAVGDQYGSATAIGRDTTAEVAEDLDISQDQVNACLGNIDINGDNNGDNNGDDNGDGDEGDAKADVIDKTIPKVDELPKTGGPSLAVLLAGAALVAGGASLIGFSVRR